ncbi:F-box protein CPR30-like [Hibiscus syriacus]|uniref:F-box protein CPR30-like n=1 Tax=Hibiscus syriacus TaxID=106335 RepID=A0A6A2XKD2_HIBSY|nr:F-box protein CPR30-like [Hibiscus syriacus]
MKGRSSKHETKDRMEIDKSSKLKEEPHLSGAYIRNLVKQLTTSGTKNHPDDGFDGQNSARFGEGFSETPPQTTQQQPQPQQHKKQVRRRLHTSRPYQERLLNMAEARREIVTALKSHRASMKHANDQQSQQQHLQQEQQLLSHTTSHLSSPPPPFEQEPKTKCRSPRIYPSSTTNNLSSYNLYSFSSFSQHYPPPTPAPANPYSWPCFSSPTDAINFTLPNQTLGLNLNFQDFNTIDTSLYRNNNNPSIYSSSSPSSSSSPTLSVVTEEVPSVALSSHEVGADLTKSHGGGGLHQTTDDEEMTEIRSLGEQHQKEWDDTVNLVTSAWWFKYLKTMELGAPEVKAEEEDEYQPFDQVMEFPAWLKQMTPACNTISLIFALMTTQDPALPCMDIGEIEGMDGEWLS